MKQSDIEKETIMDQSSYLKVCKSCGEDFAKSVKECPHCGKTLATEENRWPEPTKDDRVFVATATETETEYIDFSQLWCLGKAKGGG